jgi:hypothetical protein
MGISYFSKANWDALNDLMFCNYAVMSAGNAIGDKGCKYLSRVELNNLYHLELST